MTSNEHEPSSKWNQHSGFSEHSRYMYPYHVHGSGIRSSLVVLLKELEANLDYLCSGGTQGYIVTVHPNEGLQMFKKFFYLPLQQTLLLSIDPLQTITEANVQAHDLSVRQCYLNGERHLRFYKEYTVQNCRIECLSNFTLARCGCVRISHPRKSFMSASSLSAANCTNTFYFLGAIGTKICGTQKIECYREIDGDLFRMFALPSCNCLESCASLHYNSKSSQTAYNYNQFELDDKSKSNNHKYIYTIGMKNF